MSERACARARCNYGGNSRHAGFDAEQPARRGYVVPLHENNPSVPRSDALPCRWKEVPAEIPAGCGPQKAPASLDLSVSLPNFLCQPLFFSSLFPLCLSMRSLSLSRNSRHVPSVHRELLLLAVVADQSPKRIINARANQSGWL